MEKFNWKKSAYIVGAVAGIVALSGCSNYSGEGNEFVVVGQVTDPGEESLKADITKIIETNGDADGWFKIGHEHQLHDNCDCDDGFFRSNITVGKVLDFSGAEIEPDSVLEGACIVFEGTIRDDLTSNGKTSYGKPRPVYNTAQIVEC